MTTETSLHLSEEAMNDILIGLGSPESESHLAACTECRAQLLAFTGEMQLFNQTSLAWSEARSATLGPVVPPAKHPAIFAELGLALAAALLLAIGLPVWMHSRGPAKQTVQTAATATHQDSAEQIAADNELMQSVDMALSSSEESPLSDYQMIERPQEGPKVLLGLRHP